MKKDPFEVVAKLFETRYVGSSCMLFCGSASKGLHGPDSDLDVVVVFKSLFQAYRETFRADGWLVDAQIHDLETLNYVMSSDAKLGSAILATMVSDSIVVPTPTSSSDQAQNLARQILASGPPQNDLAGARYMVANMLADLKQSDCPHETLALGAELYKVLALLFLRSKNQWLVSKKMLPRALKSVDDSVEGDFYQAFSELFRNNNVAGVVAFSENLLRPLGGPLSEGFSVRYPANARMKVEKALGYQLRC